MVIAVVQIGEVLLIQDPEDPEDEYYGIVQKLMVLKANGAEPRMAYFGTLV